MNINWKVRLKSKEFWAAIIPATLLLISQILACFGIDFDSANACEKLEPIVGSVFIILAMLGIVVDPTTEGVGDSELAQSYTSPRTSDEVESIYFTQKGLEEVSEEDVDKQFVSEDTQIEIDVKGVK